MYTYLCLRLRKLLKKAWNRRTSSRSSARIPMSKICVVTRPIERERASSLHEYLDPNPGRWRWWRPWYIPLVLAPIIYFIIIITIRRDEGFATRPQLRQSNQRTKTSPAFLEQVHYNSTKSEGNTKSTNHDFDASLSKISHNSKPITNAVTSSISKVSTNISWCDMEEYLEAVTRNPELLISSDVNVNASGVASKNKSIEQYFDQVQPGGYHLPTSCRPRHKVAIIVPFRKREANLAVFLYHMHPFLIDQHLEYRIFVVEQYGKDLFNKGRLMNAGYLEASKLASWQCYVFHDVDLLPMDRRILYTCPTWPRHMCASVDNQSFNTSYHTYFGGVSSMTAQHLKTVNGFSNLYWGWGGEDTDMFWRLRAAKMSVTRYRKEIAKFKSLPHEKQPESSRKNKLLKSAILRYQQDGLSYLKYKVVSVKLLHLYTRFLIEVNPKEK